jgi:acetyl-CoA carboxylase carboxyltransferase component
MEGGEAPSDLDRLVEDLAERRQRALTMGGEAAVEKQHTRGKLTARERLELARLRHRATARRASAGSMASSTIAQLAGNVSEHADEPTTPWASWGPPN